jgi:DNA-binding transcriptional LysR family regulator
MKDSPPLPPSDFQGLPNLSFRQLEVFRVIYGERSYANAAIELRSTRANIKRMCDEFEREVGRPLFVEGEDKELQPTEFAEGLLSHLIPLSRALRRLGEGVRTLHEDGRLVRFAAPEAFFGGGVFTEFLSRLQIKDLFRPCFLKVDVRRFRTALLNSECDVYFGVGLVDSERLDVVDLGKVPWKIVHGREGLGEIPADVAELPAGKWKIVRSGEDGSANHVLQAFHAAGAVGGELIHRAADDKYESDALILQPGLKGAIASEITKSWPCYRFTAMLRKHHPYSELKTRLAEASVPD